MNLQQLLRFLITNGQEWVQVQRHLHRAAARTLLESEKAAMRPFFRDQVLDDARVLHVPLIENPGFYAELKTVGVSPPLDFRETEGITFVDTILVSEAMHPHSPPQLGLVLHELVHVVQYAILGVGDFVDRYVRGWAKWGKVYRKIPLERHAYALQERFERDPNQGFNVEQIVQTFRDYV